MPQEHLIAAQEATLQRLLDWIKAVDVKVPIIMVVNLAMLGALAASAPDPKNWNIQIGIIAFCAAALPAASLYFCFCATLPQLHGPGRSLLYFGEIAKRSVEEYNMDLNAQTRDQYLRDLNLQCHRNSEIAVSKHRNVKWAMRVLVPGTALWLAGMYLLKVGL